MVLAMLAALTITLAPGKALQPVSEFSPPVIWFDRPAKPGSDWVSALPMGNGTLAAMEYGGVNQNRILINEISLWAGPPVPEIPSDAAVHIKAAREHLFAGRHADADAAMRKAMVPELSPRSYQPVGHLTITHRGREAETLRVTQWTRDGKSVNVATEAVAPQSTATFHGTVMLTAEQSAAFDTITFSPIDDLGRIELNGELLLETRDYSQTHDVSVAGKLKPGDNALTVTVTNQGGAGHGPATVEFSSSQAGEGYRRELDLSTSVVTTTVPDERRESFVSTGIAKVFRYRTVATGERLLDLDIGFETENGAVTVTPDGLLVLGQASHGESHKGVRYATAITVNSDKGRGAKVDQARWVEVTLTVETDYNPDDPSKPLGKNLQEVVEHRVKQASARQHDDMRDEAIAEHRVYFDRSRLRLGTLEENALESALPIDKRLERYRQSPDDLGLEALVYEYGRYLLITSSRSKLPANLQGIWNPHMAAPWNADYHTNINLQMNYWHAEVASLQDLHEPVFWLTEGLAKFGGAKLARTLGSEGFTVGHTTDVWLWAAMTGEPVWGAWPVAGGWLTTHMMEHYRFSGDREFLKQRAYPMLKAAAQFYLGWLVEDPTTGKLVSGPTTSPENTFRIDDKTYVLSMGTTMDQMIIGQTFADVMEAAKVLGIEDAFIERVRQARMNLARPKIGGDGRLMEWTKEYEEAEPGHRHISHIFALHPGAAITQADTALFAAARKSLESRLAQGGGHTGWSRAWIINIWARLLDADKAHENLEALLQKSMVGALLDNHPPFQIDGNFGGAAGIAEMLVQSHEMRDGLPVVRLLPAMPDAWRDFKMTGLRTRAGLTVAFDRAGGGRTSATLVATREVRCYMVWGSDPVTDGVLTVLPKGGSTVLRAPATP